VANGKDRSQTFVDVFARCIAIMFASWLPLLAMALPFGPAHRSNALVCGVAVMVLSWGALSFNRARYAAAAVAAWVAVSSIVFWSSHLEAIVTVTWGVLIFFGMIGPFSAEVESKGHQPPVPQETIAQEDDHHLEHAA
jgi:hypothetical protein